jgi:tRNA(Arg) A34 adenosine deaminase TadA
MNDTELLRMAIDLATAAGRDGELPYGSLLVGADGEILARDHNTMLSSGDITAHPELKLARWAALTFTPEECRGITMYTSCQPCTMCSPVIARARLGRVVFALSAEQLHELQPDDLPPPDAAEVHYDGPFELDAAAAPISAYYGTR